MLGKAASIFVGLLVSYSGLPFCVIPRWDVDGVFLSRIKSGTPYCPPDVIGVFLCPVCLVHLVLSLTFFSVPFLSFILSVLTGLFWTWGNRTDQQ